MNILHLIIVWLFFSNAIAWVGVVVGEDPTINRWGTALIVVLSPLAPLLFVWYMLFVYRRAKGPVEREPS